MCIRDRLQGSYTEFHGIRIRVRFRNGCIRVNAASRCPVDGAGPKLLRTVSHIPDGVDTGILTQRFQIIKLGGRITQGLSLIHIFDIAFARPFQRGVEGAEEAEPALFLLLPFQQQNAQRGAERCV